MDILKILHENALERTICVHRNELIKLNNELSKLRKQSQKISNNRNLDKIIKKNDIVSIKKNIKNIKEQIKMVTYIIQLKTQNINITNNDIEAFISKYICDTVPYYTDDKQSFEKLKKDVQNTTNINQQIEMLTVLYEKSVKYKREACRITNDMNKMSHVLSTKGCRCSYCVNYWTQDFD